MTDIIIIALVYASHRFVKYLYLVADDLSNYKLPVPVGVACADRYLDSVIYDMATTDNTSYTTNLSF